MHDRRLDGEVLTFGNLGTLFMRAMTWWDHGTKSVWSQPWGGSIWGELEGATLTLLPSEVVPWATWLADHPDTTVLVDERGLSYNPDFLDYDYVIGVAVREEASAYYFASLKKVGVLNDRVGKFPIVVSVDPDTQAVRVFLRDRVDSPVDPEALVPPLLTFDPGGPGQIVDRETGTVWDTRLGIAVEGPLRGAALQQLPYTTAFDWAWEDFFANSDFWGESGLRGSGSPGS